MPRSAQSAAFRCRQPPAWIVSCRHWARYTVARAGQKERSWAQDRRDLANVGLGDRGGGMRRLLLGLSVLPLLVSGASAGQPLSDQQMDLVVAARSNPFADPFSKAARQQPIPPGQTDPSLSPSQTGASIVLGQTIPSLSPGQTDPSIALGQTGPPLSPSQTGASIVLGQTIPSIPPQPTGLSIEETTPSIPPQPTGLSIEETTPSIPPQPTGLSIEETIPSFILLGHPF